LRLTSFAARAVGGLTPFDRPFPVRIAALPLVPPRFARDQPLILTKERL